MSREKFTQELRRLQDEILSLGAMVEGTIRDSVDALKRRDLDASRRLISYDQRINERRYAIENDTLTLIATQQPMAGDVRILAAILEIAGELERIGDYAKGISRINLMIGEGPLLKPLVDIPHMANKANSMLHRSLDALVQRNVELARALPAEDDEVDNLYNQVYRELITMIMANPNNIDQATYLLWAAHNLERTADRVLNICERIIYAVTGEMIELNAIQTNRA